MVNYFFFDIFNSDWEPMVYKFSITNSIAIVFQLQNSQAIILERS